MTRIASAAANQHMVSTALRTQQRMLDAQRQVATEQRAADYAGLARHTPRLIGLENTRALLNRFDETNAALQARLDAVSTSLSAVDETIRDFRQVVLDNGSSRPLNETTVKDIQTWAFHALEEMQSYLNIRVDGRYVFAGSAVQTPPVDLGVDSLADFQAAFDGRTTTVASSRLANLQSARIEQPGPWLVFEESASDPSRIRASSATFAGLAEGTTITVAGTGANDGRYTVSRVVDAQTIEVATMKVVSEPADPADPAVAARLTTNAGLSLDPATTGGMRFDGATGTLTAEAAGTLAEIAPGTIVRVDGSATNDTTFEVIGNDGTTISVRTRTLTDTGGGAVAGSIRVDGYYRGDTIVERHQIDADRAVTFDVTAAHPAFEKAMRAMAMLAQGEYGSAGGLERHPERIDEALALLNSALDGRTAGPMAPAGEDGSHLEQVRGSVAFERMIIDEASARRRDLSAAIEGRAQAIEAIDPTEAIVRFMAESQALEASFQTLARIKGLSLSRFL